VIVKDSLNHALSILFGDPRDFTLERRLFNTISLLNAIANLGGAASLANPRNNLYLLGLHLGTGILFLVFYYCSRFRGVWRTLYWPFVLLMAGFLFANTLANAGSFGGAHYYLIPGLAIAIILSTGPGKTVLAILIFTAVTALLLLIEQTRPGWITMHNDARERALDIVRNLLFVQLFTGILVLVLAKNLNQERRKSDRLLLNILPETIAQELKKTDRVQPLAYESASVLFTDFVDFTHIAEALSPRQLIEELDNCFRTFDRIAKRHNLEKIKTIGDAYMAAGGIPQPNHTHAVDCVLAALGIQEFIEKMAAEKVAANNPYWQLRLGIHTGSLVAGVIGQEKFAYDVWGDTVNTASRLESSGVAGRINISSATYQSVEAFFACQHRGKITAKNKGEIDMYFVDGIRPDLSVGGEGKLPNDRFFDLYKRMAEARSATSA
jgi:adenylate cyclase